MPDINYFAVVALSAITADTFRANLRRLAGRDRYQFPPAVVPVNFKPAAVFIPFWADGADIFVALTRRSVNLRSHPGEVSFAGGILESGESATEAACREFEEELGVTAAGAEIFGFLDDAWSGAKRMITPVVAWLPAPPIFKPNEAEVASVITPSVAKLLTIARQGDYVEWEGARYWNITLDWGTERSYGLTSDLLLEALDWGVGDKPQRGPERLAELRGFLQSDQKFR